MNLHKLGLSEQVPARAVFLTDGASRMVRIGPMTIRLRRTTPRNMAAAGRPSGLVIQALRELGREHITPERIAHLKRTLPPPSVEGWSRTSSWPRPECIHSSVNWPEG